MLSNTYDEAAIGDRTHISEWASKDTFENLFSVSWRHYY